MLWDNEAPSLATHPIQTEAKQAQALARGFITEAGQLGSVWYKGHSLCQLQIIIPGASGLQHAKTWNDEETAWAEAQRVIEQWEEEEVCPRHIVRLTASGAYQCARCGQTRESMKGSRSDG